ncbi:MAG: hypothetical protein KDA84_15705, partial [Planctomycetaceae bacterium]|nr:hypothetical protein [Planctomycetaceae bacterium]
LFGYFQQFVQELEGEKRKKGFEVIHTPDVLHINAKGDIVGKYNGMKPADMTLLRRALLAEVEQLAQNASSSDSETQSPPPPAIAEKPHMESEGN